MLWWSGPAREHAGRAVVVAEMCACNVFDRVSAGSAPAISGKRDGQALRGRVGEHLGSKGQLQDVVVGCFAAGCSNAHGGGHVHGMDA